MYIDFQGVVLTHQNLVATMKCLMFMLEPMPDETYIAYLPLAHVLELLSENTMLLFGIKVSKIRLTINIFIVLYICIYIYIDMILAYLILNRWAIRLLTL